MRGRHTKPKERKELIDSLYRKCEVGCTRLGGKKQTPWCELCRAAAALKWQYDTLLRAYETNRRLHRHELYQQQLLREVHPSTRGIYFIKCGDSIKIGLARDVSSRARSFNGMPQAIIPLGFIRVDGDLRERESEIHRLFAHIRQRGEWFQDCDELRRFIATETKPWPRAVAS